ncbi:MAG: hypothetical protein K8L91_33525 [Anaerolineae bacterium]|nr:hypothetical protein [Anaerolineae bacterium]
MDFQTLCTLTGEQQNAWDSSEVTQSIPQVVLTPIHAKALYTLGIMLQSIQSARKLLTHTDGGLYEEFMVPAILMSCAAVEVYGYYLGGTNMADALEKGLNMFFVDPPLNVNITNEQGQPDHYTYTTYDLKRLRNFAGHGQKKITDKRNGPAVRELRLHIELLDSFPIRLKKMVNTFWHDVSTDMNSQKNLAEAQIYPHYLDMELQNHQFKPPHQYAYEITNSPQIKTPSEVIETDAAGEWNIYKAIYKRNSGG